ncbi:hypothetical protein OUZ56_022436 [Daphnia magna]|uniref:Uncharacterized protein n=1 Tax=Daphnia magna TaxID=35525 RepID=A0ABR0AWN0_9CRUS|nr:hypothetical protein OUZ56_022436 [Daphnia magna]
MPLLVETKQEFHLIYIVQLWKFHIGQREITVKSLFRLIHVADLTAMKITKHQLKLIKSAVLVSKCIHANV